MDVKESEQKISSGELLQLVSFHLGDEEYAADILNIQGINRMVDVTKVPNTPEYVEGIINLRGKVIPIIDLRKRLMLPVKEYDKNTRFIVIELEQNVVGFIVDSVNEVLRIDSNLTEAPPQSVSNVNTEFITSVAKLEDRLIILLDMDKILSENEQKQLGNIEFNNK